MDNHSIIADCEHMRSDPEFFQFDTYEADDKTLPNAIQKQKFLNLAGCLIRLANSDHFSSTELVKALDHVEEAADGLDLELDGFEEAAQ